MKSFIASPSYDADGNQTRVKTGTGIWAISYDAENRPTGFTSQAADGTITSVHCEYDYTGRRTTKMVTVGNNVTLQQRYIYRGYLQIASIDLTRSHHPALRYITWDPTPLVATRPLAIQKDGTWFTYGCDLTKNICELYGAAGYIRTAYTYSPYGEVTANGDVAQPIQWSSEFNDTGLGLVYYNYRHYNPMDGRWIGRDIIFNTNPYCYVNNAPVYYFDICGAIAPIPILVGVFLSLGVAYGINSYLKYSRHRAGHVRIYAPDYFGYDENISAFMEKVNKLRDLYTGKVLYDFNVFERSEFQKVIQIIENRSDEKCIRKLVLAAHGKASPKD